MSKIKVIQIAKGYNPDGDDITEYLDSEGRVWYQASRRETLPGDTEPSCVTEWLQLELPEEPSHA